MYDKTLNCNLIGLPIGLICLIGMIGIGPIASGGSDGSCGSSAADAVPRICDAPNSQRNPLLNFWARYARYILQRTRYERAQLQQARYARFPAFLGKKGSFLPLGGGWWRWIL